MTEVPICQDDMDRINALVDQYRHSLLRLYEVAYLQGQIDAQEDERDRLKAQLARAVA